MKPGALLAISLAIAGAVCYALSQMRVAPPVLATLPQGNVQPDGQPGDQHVWGSAIDMLPSCVPHLSRTPDWIPADAFVAMTRIMNVNQPEMLYNAMLSARYQTTPIPQTVDLIPTPAAPPVAYATDESRMWGGSQ